MTEDELVSFLKRHRIKSEEIFNAKGLRRIEYAELMKKNGKLFAINTDACGNGHRLKTHSGHCVICDSENIHHYRLHYRTSFVYVAGSKSKRALKIGTSDDPNDRMRRLNGEAYGGAYDWVLLIDAWTKEAGRKEKEIQSALRRFFVKGEYIKSGKTVSTYELVSCGLSTARDVMREVLSNDEKPKFNSKLQVTLAQYESES